LHVVLSGSPRGRSDAAADYDRHAFEMQVVGEFFLLRLALFVEFALFSSISLESRIQNARVKESKAVVDQQSSLSTCKHSIHAGETE
jgi:hypothetical protein